MAGGVENVIATNNTMVAVESAIYFKSNLDRGAWVTDVVFDGLVSHHAKGCISFDNNYHGARGGNFPTLFKNYTLRNVLCTSISGTGMLVTPPSKESARCSRYYVSAQILCLPRQARVTARKQPLPAGRHLCGRPAADADPGRDA